MGKAEKALCIALFSKKGGVGRSFLAAGLARALSAKGKTLLFDLDGAVHTCDILLGLENEAIFSLDDLIGGAAPDRVLRSSPEEPDLFLCPAPCGEDCFSAPCAAERMLGAARAVGADYILLDAPARGDACGFALAMADRPLVVSGFDALSVLAAEITAQQIDFSGKTPLLLLNRFSPNGERTCGAAEIIDRTHAPLLGVVPEKSAVGQRDLEQVLSNVAARLTGEERPLFSGLPDEKKLRRML